MRPPRGRPTGLGGLSSCQCPVARRSTRPRPKMSKLTQNERRRDYVQDRLAGKIAKPSGGLVAGPEVPWIGRRHGRRADRSWARAWSPEQIANRLVVHLPDDVSIPARSWRLSNCWIPCPTRTGGAGAAACRATAGFAPGERAAPGGPAGAPRPSLADPRALIGGQLDAR